MKGFYPYAIKKRLLVFHQFLFFDAALISNKHRYCDQSHIIFYMHFFQYKIDNFELPTNIYHKLCLIHLVNFFKLHKHTFAISPIFSVEE